MRVAMLSSISERVKELSEGLMKDQTIDDIAELVKSMPTADEFFSELTRRREGVGMPRWETQELLRRSELRGWLDEIQSILRESEDGEDEENEKGEEEHDVESDEECEKWMDEYEKKKDEDDNGEACVMRAKFGAETSTDLIVSFGKTELTQEALRHAWRTMTLSIAEHGASAKDRRRLEMMTNADTLTTAGLKRVHFHIEIIGESEGSIGDSKRCANRKRVREIQERILMARLTDKIREMNKKMKVTVSIVEDEASDIWEKKETKELVRTARMFIGGVDRIRIGTEKETLRLVQRYPQGIYPEEQPKRIYH